MTTSNRDTGITQSMQDESTASKKTLTVDMTEELYNLLRDVIAPFYRTESLAHATRLMIQDMAEGVKMNGLTPGVKIVPAVPIVPKGDGKGE